MISRGELLFFPSGNWSFDSDRISGYFLSSMPTSLLLFYMFQLSFLCVLFFNSSCTIVSLTFYSILNYLISYLFKFWTHFKRILLVLTKSNVVRYFLLYSIVLGIVCVSFVRLVSHTVQSKSKEWWEVEYVRCECSWYRLKIIKSYLYVLLIEVLELPV